jgi:hypothetical protein
MRAIRKECREILLGGAVQNMHRMLELCCDPDPRVRAVAIQECNNRLWGRASDIGMADDQTSITNIHDISHLSTAERAEVRTMVARLRMLLTRPATGPVLDAQPTDKEGDQG